VSQRLAAGLGLAVLLAGCAIERGIALPPMDDWETRRAVLGRVSEWSFSGRIGVSAGDEGFNGRLRWSQRQDSYEATVSGPFGAGSVRLDGDGRRVRLTDPEGEVTELVDAEHDLHTMYGWTIPVASLRYWALGIPDPATPAVTEFGEDGQLARLAQNSWVVEIGQYREASGQPMPRRITASSTETRVRLVIDGWTFH